jgi:uncharacterized protein YggE
MIQLLRSFIFVIFPALAFGQLDSNSVTVTASNNVTLQPDQATFAISVTSDVNSTLSDVLSAVQPAGLTLANFLGIGTSYSYPGGSQGLNWTFNLAVPITQIKATSAMLVGLQKSVPLANQNLSISFSIVGTQVSQQLQQSQPCSYATLLASAQTQAQAMAMAGGRTLSGVLAMSAGTSTTTGSGVSYGAVAPPTCSLTVKFALLGS